MAARSPDSEFDDAHEHEDGAALYGNREKIGRFTILHRLGSGGMGEVYAAYDEQLDRKVALKVLKRARRISDQARQRLMREARALARLSHQNVVAIYDAGVYEGEVYIAMEFVRGPTLDERLQQQSRSWGEILQVFIAMADGLSAAHQLGIIHRDIKPQNVLIDPKGRPRLIDFGLARADEDPREFGGLSNYIALPDDTGLTRTGALMGTPRYMSPEQFAHHEVTPQSDQFSFCVAIFEALYGQAPFEGERLHARAAAVLEGKRRPVPTNSGVPDELLAVVSRGLRPNPEERWPNMTALLTTLNGVLSAYDPEIEEPDVRRLRRRVLLGLIGVVALALVAFGGIATSAHLAINAASVLALDAVLLVSIGLTAGLTRKRWTVNRQSRRLVSFILLLTVVYCAQDLSGFFIERPLYHTSLANAVSFTILCFFVAPLTTRTLRWAGLWAGEQRLDRCTHHQHGAGLHNWRLSRRTWVDHTKDPRCWCRACQGRRPRPCDSPPGCAGVCTRHLAPGEFAPPSSPYAFERSSLDELAFDP